MVHYPLLNLTPNNLGRNSSMYRSKLPISTHSQSTQPNLWPQSQTFDLPLHLGYVCYQASPPCDRSHTHRVRGTSPYVKAARHTWQHPGVTLPTLRHSAAKCKVTLRQLLTHCVCLAGSVCFNYAAG